MLNFPGVPILFANFTIIGMIGNETGHVLKCVKLYAKFININEIWHMFRKKHCCYFAENFMENLYSVKCYDKTNTKVFALSLCENISLGLIYFDQAPGLKKTFFMLNSTEHEISTAHKS